MKTLLTCIALVTALCYAANYTPPPQQVVVVVVEKMRDTNTLMLRTVAKIESNDNERAQRFEPHLHKRFATSNTEWRARAMATSLGKYQILGCNFRTCGYATLDAFMRDMKTSGAKQDSAFVKFCKATGCDTLFKKQDWQRFAARYNGKGYRRNKYDTKLQRTFAGLR